MRKRIMTAFLTAAALAFAASPAVAAAAPTASSESASVAQQNNLDREQTNPQGPFAFDRQAPASSGGSGGVSTQALAVCNFQQLLDSMHWSSTQKPPYGTISIHGYWKNIDCKASQAVVTVQLERKVNGKWVSIGNQGVNKKAYSGGGSANRANSRYDCKGGQIYKYRAWVDVDLIGLADTAARSYSPEYEWNCG